MAINNSQSADLFWDTDLEVIERTFLDDGQEITDLPIHLNDVVPSQGSVLLPKARKICID